MFMYLSVFIYFIICTSLFYSFLGQSSIVLKFYLQTRIASRRRLDVYGIDGLRLLDVY